jgi:PAS domain-containing protein
VAFADVTTSPAYDLLLVITVAILAFALSSTARALVGVCARAGERVRSLEHELARLRELTKQMVTHAPSAEALVLSNSGRIVYVSDRFMQTFSLPDASGQFLLDVVDFTYPAVIRRLIMTGGEEIQGATLGTRDVLLRVRAETMGAGDFQVSVLNIERCDDIYWRGQVDALDDPVFAVNPGGEVVFLNRCALAIFGQHAEGLSAATLFEAGARRWWDIAPLDVARRTFDWGEHRYVASIRRTRIAESIGELSFVHLQEVRSNRAVAAS